MLILNFDKEKFETIKANISKEEEDSIIKTDGNEDKLDNSNVIKNISFDQSEILWNIMQLYNNGEPFDCDMTASELKFYGERKGYK